MSFDREQTVLIIGAGVFGLSTALHLLRRGWNHITIIDRSSVLPAPDAASTDINKVVRSCYSDPVYTRLAREAILAWRDTDEWGDTYHESGVLVRGGSGSYAETSLQNDIALGAKVKKLHSSEEMRSHLPFDGTLGPLLLSDFEGYIAFEGGWANAKQGVEFATEKVRRLGARIEPGKVVTGLSPDGKGVKLQDGTEMRADLIIIASGSWTASSFPDLGITDQITATGQSLATVQLSEEEAKMYANVPVILDYTTGFYIFPPTSSHVVKFSFHAPGYTNAEGRHGISTPRTHVTHPGAGTIPHEVATSLRQSLAAVYPDLGVRPFAGTRMCWYTDTPDSDWLIDFHPGYPSVLFATGGSGHGYKFLPTLGRLVADRLENKLEPALVKKFAFNRTLDKSDKSDSSRAAQNPKALDISRLYFDGESELTKA